MRPLPVAAACSLSTLMLAALCLPLPAAAAKTVQASCSVGLDYALNGTVLAPYLRDFSVQAGTDYVDDFSTVTRQKVFRATVERTASASSFARLADGSLLLRKGRRDYRMLRAG